MSVQLSNTIKSTLLASVAVTVMNLSMASTAIAQTSDAASESDEIIVTGIRATIDDALQNKRKADLILDGIRS